MCLFALHIAPALADDLVKEREAHAKNIATMTLAILQDQKKDFSDREAAMQRGILNMVDVPFVAKFVLGNAWRNADAEQRERYTALYGKYLTKMYISNFAQNRDRKVRDIKVLGIADSQPQRYMVRTEIALSTDEDIHVDYVVSEQNNLHQIIDISIEGVSLLASHRAEFSQIAASKGVDGVIVELERRVKSDQVLAFRQ